jgi:hypothetical protein
LSRERPIRSRLKRLSRYQIELVHERRRRSGNALSNLPADGIETGVDTESSGSFAPGLIVRLDGLTDSEKSACGAACALKWMNKIADANTNSLRG